MSQSSSFYHVEPLRSSKEIKDMTAAIRRGNKTRPKNTFLAQRDTFLFVLGIHTGLRVNDLRLLQVSDVKHPSLLTIIEDKSHRNRVIDIGVLHQEMQDYIRGKQENAYLFSSWNKNIPISALHVYRILTEAAERLERQDIGTHTMRKTYGYHHYQRYQDIKKLQKLFNHASPSETKRYIGIDSDGYGNI